MYINSFGPHNNPTGYFLIMFHFTNKKTKVQRIQFLKKILLSFTLQYCIGFAMHQHESAMGVHEFPILNPPPHTISLGDPSAPASSILYPASNLDWQFITYMILYMFQCHSPKSSHPLPLPQSPKDCSIHLCLFCCLTYRIIVTIFLNSIYMC